VQVQLAVQVAVMQVAAARRTLILKIPQEPLQAANAGKIDAMVDMKTEMNDAPIEMNEETKEETNEVKIPLTCFVSGIIFPFYIYTSFHLNPFIRQSG
jgi:hypothetical protein